MNLPAARKKLIRLKGIALGALLLSGYYAVSQTSYADSLCARLLTHRQNDTVKVNMLNELAREIRGTKPHYADSFINVSIQLSDLLNYAKGKGNALSIKARRYYDKSNSFLAHKTFEEARPLLKTIDDKKGLAYLLRMEGSAFMDEGNYAAALQDFFQALEFAQEEGDIKQVVDVERLIGYFYNMIGEPEKAIPYQQDALIMAQKINYKTGVAGTYNTIGKTFKTLGNYEAALSAYENSLLIYQAMGDSINFFVAISNIGEVNERMGRYEKALDNITSTLRFLNAQGGGHIDVRAWNEYLIGLTHLHSGNPDSGLYYGKRSLELSYQANWHLYISEISRLIAESAAKLKQYDTAYKYQLLSAFLKDSLNGRATAHKTTMLQAQIELNKKQAEIALLTKDQQLKIAESKRQRLFIYAVLSGLAFLLALAVVLFRNNRNKQKANLLLQKQKKEIDHQRQKVEQTLEELRSTQAQLIQSEKEKIFAHHHKELLGLEAKALRAQMNPHFIYNCMNSIKALIQGDDKLRSIEYLTTFSKLIRTIFQNSNKRQISLYDEIETCKLYTQLESMRLNGKLQYNFCIDPNLDLKSVMVPALIVQPFIENAIWHGIVPKEGGGINISVKGSEDAVVCEVDDDGIGREMSKLNKPGTPIIHESKGVHLSKQRLHLEKMLNDTNASIEIIDKYENKIATGTKVILNFNLS